MIQWEQMSMLSRARWEELHRLRDEEHRCQQEIILKFVDVKVNSLSVLHVFILFELNFC